MFRTSRTAASGAAAHLGVCILAGCALIAAATWATGDSTPRRQAKGTHLGVAPSDMVTLLSSGNGTSLKFLRANADGTTDTSEFVVPSGYQLVVTDLDWAGTASNTLLGVTLRVWVENKTTSTTRRLAYLQSEFMLNSTTTSGGGTTNPGGSSSGLFAGFNVSSAARLTADIANTQSVASTSFGSVSWSPTIILRGYLTVDE